MNLKEIKELVDLITEKAITEFELERAGVRLRIRRGAPETAPPVLAPAAAPAPSPQPVAGVPPASPAALVPAPPPAAATELPADAHVVKSPIVGTFYEAPSPGAPPFVRIGDHVQPGKVLCIIEAMKLMNEIESEVAGEVVKRFVDNAQPVEYGEPLFAIRPAGKT